MLIPYTASSNRKLFTSATQRRNRKIQCWGVSLVRADLPHVPVICGSFIIEFNHRNLGCSKGVSTTCFNIDLWMSKHDSIICFALLHISVWEHIYQIRPDGNVFLYKSGYYDFEIGKKIAWHSCSSSAFDSQMTVNRQ